MAVLTGDLCLSSGGSSWAWLCYTRSKPVNTRILRIGWLTVSKTAITLPNRWGQRPRRQGSSVTCCSELTSMAGSGNGDPRSPGGPSPPNCGGPQAWTSLPKRCGSGSRSRRRDDLPAAWRAWAWQRLAGRGSSRQPRMGWAWLGRRGLASQALAGQGTAATERRGSAARGSAAHGMARRGKPATDWRGSARHRVAALGRAPHGSNGGSRQGSARRRPGRARSGMALHGTAARAWRGRSRRRTARRA